MKDDFWNIQSVGARIINQRARRAKLHYQRMEQEGTKTSQAGSFSEEGKQRSKWIAELAALVFAIARPGS